MIQETIEIGAICLDNYGDMLGSYNRFVRPVVHPYLSPFCKELTTISQHDVNNAGTFPQVIEGFQDWAEIFEKDYLLCSWGSFDKKMLINDSILYKLDHSWVENHINLKRQYHEYKRLNRPFGLKKAVEKEGLEFTGIHHRGISDAENLAKLFCKHLDIWQY